MGISCPESKFQIIFAGYDGPKRKEIKSTSSLNSFFSTLETKSDEEVRDQVLKGICSDLADDRCWRVLFLENDGGDESTLKNS
jgi:hypothetical protein